MKKDRETEDMELHQLPDLVEMANQEGLEDDVRSWENEPETYTWEELFMMKTAVRSHYGADPDVDEALRRVRKRRSKRMIPWPAIWITVAACCLFLFGIYAWRNLMPTPDSRYIAYERKLEQTGLKTTAPTHKIDMSNEGTIPQHLLSKGSNGQWVLDYKKALTEGMPVSGDIETNSVTMPYGKDLKIVLADGTEVWLYADSKLTYPSAFPGDERKVYLKGEAYFKVAKDARKPFVIYTDKMYAKVLGTELNVRSYDQQPPQVVLINGAVQVADVKSGKQINLNPGQKVQLNESELTVTAENVERYVYWRNGYMFFDDVKLSEIATALEQWYKIDVVFDDNSLQDLQLRFFFYRSDTLERTIQLLNAFGLFKAYTHNGTLHLQPQQ